MASLNVVVAGASGVGKTTLVQSLDGRRLPAGHRIEAARRVVTRNQRLGEDPTESDFVSQPELHTLVAHGRVPFVWSRSFADRDEWYGFRRTGDAEVVIFPGNDALIPQLGRLAERFLGPVLLVVLTCPQEERERRLQNRSPDLWLDPGQITTRLAPASVPVSDEPMLVIPSIDRDANAAIVLSLIDAVLRQQEAVPPVDLTLGDPARRVDPGGGRLDTGPL